MSTIMLSINPKHINNIFAGNKRYEYRKTACKRNVDKILFYATSPIKKVVGEAEVLELLEKDTEELWKETEMESGISKCFYFKYYEEKRKAVAYHLGKIIKYEEPKSLSDYGISMAPQSFVYIS